MKCERCGKEHDCSFGSGKFCSRACANSRGPRTEEFKKKVSEKLIGNIPWNKGNNTKISLICAYCGKSFINYSYRKFCSKSCADLGQDRTGQGGYREGSGRSKSGYYKGVFCGSTYELVWVIYRIDHNLLVKRFQGCIEGDGIKYYPDFIEGDHIYEMKGVWSESVDKKCELAQKHGYSIDVIYKQDLQKEFDWVKQNYSYIVLEELYDDSKKDILTYICSYCGKEFISNRKRNTKKKYCSRSCVGKNKSTKRPVSQVG